MIALATTDVKTTSETRARVNSVPIVPATALPPIHDSRGARAAKKDSVRTSARGTWMARSTRNSRHAARDQPIRNPCHRVCRLPVSL